MQVPFLLYAPGVLGERQDVPWTTSHVDIAPSLLYLLGITAGRDLHLGAPVWDSRLTQRTVFLWAERYLGADGFVQGGQYFMRQGTSELFYSSSHFDFSGATPLAIDGVETQITREKLRDAAALQYRLLHLDRTPTRP
jgi:hypothetical protein